jgi:hypothetical protein
MWAHLGLTTTTSDKVRCHWLLRHEYFSVDWSSAMLLDLDPFGVAQKMPFCEIFLLEGYFVEIQFGTWEHMLPLSKNIFSKPKKF